MPNDSMANPAAQAARMNSPVRAPERGKAAAAGTQRPINHATLDAEARAAEAEYARDKPVQPNRKT